MTKASKLGYHPDPSVERPSSSFYAAAHLNNIAELWSIKLISGLPDDLAPTGVKTNPITKELVPGESEALKIRDWPRPLIEAMEALAKVTEGRFEFACEKLRAAIKERRAGSILTKPIVNIVPKDYHRAVELVEADDQESHNRMEVQESSDEEMEDASLAILSFKRGKKLQTDLAAFLKRKEPLKHMPVDMKELREPSERRFGCTWEELLPRKPMDIRPIQQKCQNMDGSWQPRHVQCNAYDWEPGLRQAIFVLSFFAVGDLNRCRGRLMKAVKKRTKLKKLKKNREEEFTLQPVDVQTVTAQYVEELEDSEEESEEEL